MWPDDCEALEPCEKCGGFALWRAMSRPGKLKAGEFEPLWRCRVCDPSRHSEYWLLQMLGLHQLHRRQEQLDGEAALVV
jgi:hypothetical protein